MTRITTPTDSYTRYYPRIVELANKQLDEQFWTNTEMKVELDRMQLLHTLSEEQLHAVKTVLHLFVHYERKVGDFWKRLSKIFPRPEVELACSVMEMTERGICHLGFVENNLRSAALDQLFQKLPKAGFTENRNRINSIVGKIFRPDSPEDAGPFNLHLKGTNFQINVWKALLRIPAGWVVSYQDIAVYLGQPKAFRAVAGAVALNPVGYLIPCHRVIAKSGHIHGYRWGSVRKKALVGWEAARLPKA